MLITPWLRSMKSVLGSNVRKSSKAASRKRRRGGSGALEPLTGQVERLEDRTLLTTMADVQVVNGFVDVTGNDDPVDADADDHLDIDVRFDTATPTNDGAGFYLHIEATDGGTATVTAVGDFVNQISDTEVTVFVGAKLDPNAPATNPNKILKPHTKGVRVEALNGDDVVNASPAGLSGNWMPITIFGGDGDDTLTGGVAKSRLFGEDGDDSLTGGFSNDRLVGGLGKDTLIGRDGDDTLLGGAGNDLLDGGDRTAAADVVTAGTGTIDDGDDSIRGGGGNDLIIPGTSRADTNSNTVFGGAGRDTIEATDYNPRVTLSNGDHRIIPITIIRGSNPGVPDELTVFGTDKGALDATGATGADWDVAATHTLFEEIEVAHIVQTKDKAGAPRGQLSDNDIQIEQFDEVGMSYVEAAGGDDTVSTGDNADTIYGGEGDDVLNGNGGRDSINGNAGNDKLFGGEGQDVLQGGLGSDDTLFGQGGDDTLYAAAHDGVAETNIDVDFAADSLLFKTSPDRIFEHRVSDIDEFSAPGLPDATGADSLDGNNLLDGGAGADIIFGGRQADTIFGGPGGRSEYRDVPRLSETTTGEDVVTKYVLRDYDLIFTGLEYVYGLDDPDGGGTLATTHSMTPSDSAGDLVGDRRYSKLRSVKEDGGAGADLIFGTAFQDTLLAGGGHDTVVGGDEDSPGDSIDGGRGNDLLLGGAGEDTIRGNAGGDTILGGGGDDCLRGYAGDDSIDGGAGEDAISGNDGEDTLFGGSGTDDLTGGRGADSLNGGTDPDTLHGGKGADTLTGGDMSADSLLGGPDYDILFEDADADFTLTSGAPTTLTRGAAVDSLAGIEGAYYYGVGNSLNNEWDGSGFDGEQTLIGSAKDDVLKGGKGSDFIIGGSDDGTSGGGADSLLGSGGDDLILASWGAFLVNDSKEVDDPLLTPLPDDATGPGTKEKSLSDIDLPIDVDEHIVYDASGAHLVTEPDHIRPDGTPIDVVITPEEREADLHILMLDPLTGRVETVVKIDGGWETFDDGVTKHVLTGVLVTDIRPDTGATDFDTANTDTLKGSGDDDVIIGSAGIDIATGGSTSDDLIIGGDGADTLSGNGGEDTVFGLDGDDSIKGDAGDDSLDGGEGKDTIAGNDDDDTITGGPGADSLSGGSGNDQLREVGNIHAELTDTSFGHVVAGFGFETDTLVDDFEEAYIEGGDDDNNLDASGWGNGPVTLIGLAGDDTLVGAGADDSIEGGGGADSIIADGGDDFVDAGAGDDTVDAGDGDDTVLGFKGNDSIQAGDGADIVFGGLGNDTIEGDASTADAGPDTLAGGPGHDEITGGTTADVAPADGIADGNGDGEDDFLYGDGRKLELSMALVFELNLGAPDGNDTLDGQSGSDHLSGGDGDDVLIGGVDFIGIDVGDVLVGGAGDDTLLGGRDGDILIGQSGEDTIDGESNAPAAADTIDASDASDLIVPDPADSVFGQDKPAKTIGVNTYLRDILFEPDDGETFGSLTALGNLNWLDEI